MDKHVIRKIGLAIFWDGKILMAHSHGKDTWFFVGGKVELGETDRECLLRETREELGAQLDEETVKELGTFSAPAHGKPGVKVEMVLFEGQIKGEPRASSEVDELGWFGADVDRSKQTKLTNQVFDWLVEQGYVR